MKITKLGSNLNLPFWLGLKQIFYGINKSTELTEIFPIFYESPIFVVKRQNLEFQKIFFLPIV